jgi:hypothetical protein
MLFPDFEDQTKYFEDVYLSSTPYFSNYYLKIPEQEGNSAFPA